MSSLDLTKEELEVWKSYGCSVKKLIAAQIEFEEWVDELLVIVRRMDKTLHENGLDCGCTHDPNVESECAQSGS